MRSSFLIGSYSSSSPWAGAASGHGDGIVTAMLDMESGAMQRTADCAETNPAFLVCDGQRVWAVTEVESCGELVSYRCDSTGSLVDRSAVSTGARSPGHLTLDASRSLAYATNFHGRRLSLIATETDGTPATLVSLVELPASIEGENREQLQSRPHCTEIIHGNELFVTDFGRDMVALYRIDGSGETAKLALVDALPLTLGTGPRHIARRAGSEILYVSNENSASVSVLRCRPRGSKPRLELIDTAPSPGLGRVESLPSEIAIHPHLGVVYMANRRDDSISVFEIVDSTGRLRHRDAVDVRGTWPRHFRIAPGGGLLLVANQDSDSVVSFRIDQRGGLAWTGQKLEVATPSAICFC
jgi:6-phosphogluconolactonase